MKPVVIEGPKAKARRASHAGLDVFGRTHPTMGSVSCTVDRHGRWVKFPRRDRIATRGQL